MRDSVPSSRDSRVCNVLRLWRIWLIPTYRVGSLPTLYLLGTIYRRTGFKCEHVIIANCDFSPSAQLLEHMYTLRVYVRTYVRVYM